MYLCRHKALVLHMPLMYIHRSCTDVMYTVEYIVRKVRVGVYVRTSTHGRAYRYTYEYMY